MKQTKRFWWLLLSFVGVVLILAGCARSIDLTYNTGMSRLSNADKIGSLSLGIAKFDDKRSWVEKNNTKSESFVAQAGTWKFGMNYQGKEYYPIKDLIQTLFVSEFTKAGINAKPIEQVLSKQNIKDFQKLGEQNKLDFIVGGDILTFEFVNETGTWTVTSRRAVTLNLILVKVGGGEVRLDNIFNESDRENEGAGVLHSTNVDKLMNKIFKKVVQQVIEQVAAKMALNVDDVTWRVVYNGKVYNFTPDAT